MSDVVTACSKKWSDPYLCNCECDSNWMTNMYLDYNNNYISRDTFIENEIMPSLDWKSFEERNKIKTCAESLLDMFRGIGMCQCALPYDRVGEICIKILKGEV